MSIRHLNVGLLLAAALGARVAWCNEYAGLDGPMSRIGEPGTVASSPSMETYQSLPGPATAPTLTARPEAWPGGAAAPSLPDSSPWPAAAGDNAAAQAAAEPCEGAKIVARVGTEVVLAAEVRATAVYEILGQLHRKKLHPTPQQLRELVDRMWLDYLDSAVMAKLLYMDSRDEIPTEALADLDKRVATIFYEDPSGAKQLQEFVGAEGLDDLQRKLEALGTSLDWQRRLFGERILGQQGVSRNIERGGPITHEEMLGYYHEHLADYEHPAKVRWQQIMVRASRYPSREQARAALAAMGNQVLDGADFAKVARQGSDGPTAASGGLRDWTSQGSLVSKELDRAIFSLPVGPPSPILEDEQGLHIVRVLQREAASRTPFDEVQESIRQKVQQERFRRGFDDYLDRLKAQTPVWTIHDARPASGQESAAPSQVGSRPAASESLYDR